MTLILKYLILNYNLIINQLLYILTKEKNNSSIVDFQSKIKAKYIADLIRMVDEGKISKKNSKDIFYKIIETKKSPIAIIEKEGFKQISNISELEKICKEIILLNEKPTKEFKAGKENAINALKGEVMKKTSGNANPKIIDKILRKIITISL